uniref:Zinc finger protein 395 n=1 Tax=Centruroides hentzi TaxID=88313 RepID=A0A2I9LQ02_9SCOR
MSTGKRLAKRSIPGTRVCAPVEDGTYVPGVIQACKTDADDRDDVYCVLLEDDRRREYKGHQLIGPGFQSVSKAVLKTGQKVYVTYNAREVSATVIGRKPEGDDVLVTLNGRPSVRLTMKSDEVRLLESRKSARLQDQDTDYSRLADGQSEPRRRASSLGIDVPSGTGGRKRRSSAEDNVMDDCTAAMVLMSLSCSPKSSRPSEPGPSGSSWASESSWSGDRSPTRSPPSPDDRLSPSRDEGIDVDDVGGFRRDSSTADSQVMTKIVFQCTWPGCAKRYAVCEDVERHVCVTHLGRNRVGEADREEEFYYTEIEVENCRSVPPSVRGPSIYSSSVPTLSHLDMARPPHEDPEYGRRSAEHPVLLETSSGPVNIPSSSFPMSWSMHGYPASAPSTMGSSPQKFLRLTSKTASSPGKVPPHRKGRSESRKCRKVYGMDNREAWCTQCKWKKACSRFVD